MKIAIVNPWFVTPNSIGGTERFVQDLANSLSDLGNTVDVYMMSGNSYILNNVNYISMNVFGEGIIADEYMIDKKFGKLVDQKQYHLIAKELEKRYDLSQYDFIQLNSHLFLECWKKKKRIFTLHSNHNEFKILGSDDEFNVMISVMKNQVKNTKTYFITPSEYYKNEWLNIIEKNVLCIPHGLNQKRLICKIEKKKLIKKYKLNDNLIKILLPSRLEMIQKRPDLILNALSLLKNEKKSSFQVIFTGLDEQYKNNITTLKKLAKRFELNVKFIKFDNINEGYKLTDIVLIPSQSESFGYSAQEALSLGITTLLSDIPTLNEINRNSSSGIIFGNDAVSLAKNLKMLHSSNFDRKDVSSKWLEQYDLSLFASRYLKIYENE